MGTARAVVRSGIGGLVFGGVLYLAGDTSSDLMVYKKLHGQAMHLVEADPEIAQIVGQPYSSGSWYEATLAFSHRDKVAHCTFQLKGNKGVTDIAVKAGRKPGYRSNILYNFLGPGVWQLISCQAMVPDEGGLVRGKSLMPEHHQQQQQQGGGMAGVCEPCQEQQQKHQAGKAATAGFAATGQGSSGWWRRFWWRQRPSSAEALQQQWQQMTTDDRSWE